jgi:hypothetical protein
MSAGNVHSEHCPFVIQGPFEIVRNSSETTYVTPNIAEELTYGIIGTARTEVLV